MTVEAQGHVTVNKPVIYMIYIIAHTCPRGGSRANLKGGQLMMGALTNFQNFVIRVLTIMSLCTIMSDPTDGISAICVRRRAFRAIVLQE